MALIARKGRHNAGRGVATEARGPAPDGVDDAPPPPPPPPPPPAPPPPPPPTNEVAAPAPPPVAVEHDPARLGELLVRIGAITAADLAEALVQQPREGGKRIGRLLVDGGALDEQQLTEALASQMHLPIVDLSQEAPDIEVLKLVPESVARAHLVFPFAASDDPLAVDVAVGDPSEELAATLRQTTAREVRIFLANPNDVRRSIDRSYRALGGIDRLVQAFEAGDTTRSRSEDVGSLQLEVDDAPVVQIVNLLLTQALRDRASDVHIEPQDDRLRVRYRIDGALHDVSSLPASMGAALVSRLKIMAGMNIVERRRSQDGQLVVTVDGREIDVRVSTTAVIWGEKCVLRILDRRRSLYKLNELGMPPETHAAYSRLIRAPFGMVLCAGPTGSGKTTTLYASLGEINEPSRNIMTIEDPVEYVFPSINQIQTNESAGLTFATGLKSILRQDPDVILVGEIRDVETARIAVQSALTGHLVLSSLHATDAVAALHRFLDMGIESFLISSSVIAIVGQRLLRRTCPSCRVEYVPTDEEMAFYEEAGGPKKKVFWTGQGCSFCANTGYQDRIGVYEMLKITPEIKRLIVGWATQDELRRLAVSQGMSTLRDEALALVANDVTTISEVIRSIYAF
jgi:type IV pilus assembly protein PilB